MCLTPLVKRGYTPQPACLFKRLAVVAYRLYMQFYSFLCSCLSSVSPIELREKLYAHNIVPAKEIRIIYSVAVRFVLCNANQIFTVGSNKIKHKVLAVRRAVRA